MAKKYNVTAEEETDTIPELEEDTVSNDDVVIEPAKYYKNIAPAGEEPNIVECTEEEYSYIVAMQHYDLDDAIPESPVTVEVLPEPDKPDLDNTTAEFVQGSHVYFPRKDIPNDIKVLQKIQPGDNFTLTTPDKACDGLSPYDNPHYDKAELFRLLESQGCEIIESQSIKLNNITSINVCLKKIQ